MDKGASADPVDVCMSPIGSPDHFQITKEQLWRRGEPHSDDETDDTDDVSGDSKYHNRGSPQWLPHSQRGPRRIKPLTVDTNLPPLPFLCSPGYPSTIEGTPSPFSYNPSYFDPDDEILLPCTKADDNMWFRYYANPSTHDPDELDGTYVWDLPSDFSALWNERDDSDASEVLDSSSTGESASLPSELELGFRQFDLSEPGASALDFPEDAVELLDHYTLSADSDSGVIGRLGRSTPASASEITIELSTHESEDSHTPPDYALSILLPQILEPSEDSDEPESFPHPPYPGSGFTDLPINVSLSPLILATDGFPDDTSPPYLDLLGVGGEGILTDVHRLEPGSREGRVCSPCLEEDLMEWDRWRGQLIEEHDPYLDSRVSVHESVRAVLEWS